MASQSLNGNVSVQAVKCKVSPMHALKKYGGMKLELHLFLTSALDQMSTLLYPPAPAALSLANTE
jgi:hypothetical protein